jgi:hypothetical protein
MLLVHESSGLLILNSRAMKICVWFIIKLSSRFNPLSLDLVSGRRWFLIAYEVKDPIPRKYVVRAG